MTARPTVRRYYVNKPFLKKCFLRNVSEHVSMFPVTVNSVRICQVALCMQCVCVRMSALFDPDNPSLSFFLCRLHPRRHNMFILSHCPDPFCLSDTFIRKPCISCYSLHFVHTLASKHNPSVWVCVSSH